MKSYKILLNEAFQKNTHIKEMSNSDLKALQRCILDIYKKVYSVCEQNGLCMMMAEGSCLGAVRHKGFIPGRKGMFFTIHESIYAGYIDDGLGGA